MNFQELTEVPEEALPLEPLRDHLRLGRGFAEDGLQDPILISTLWAALAVIEGRTAKALFSRDFRWRADAGSFDHAIRLPRAPVSAVQTVELIDQGGLPTALPAESYLFVADTVQPKVTLNVGIANDRGIEVEFTAGYGPDWSDIPADIAQAVLVLAAHLYAHRGDTTAHPLPALVTSVIAQHRPVRLAGGTAR